MKAAAASSRERLINPLRSESATNAAGKVDQTVRNLEKPQPNPARGSDSNVSLKGNSSAGSVSLATTQATAESSRRRPLTLANGGGRVELDLDPTQPDDDEKDILNASKRFRMGQRFSNELAPTPKRKKLVWTNIEAIVRKDGEDGRMILKNISGCAKSGELTFIMGSSGAGKTTLLNILTERNLKKIVVQGRVFVNSREMQPGDMSRISAYVQQDDVFLDMLTVSETLHFAAKLRSPRQLSDDERAEIVDELMTMMSLKTCEHSRVGSITEKTLSRGERKRLAFACEVLNDPPILFCDEPTSGLDSFMAFQVVKALRKLAKEGKTIVCTIHQPSTTVYQLADKLILLCQGRVAYEGPAVDVESFLQGCGYPLPPFISLPDHFMRVVSRSPSETEAHYSERVHSICREHTQASISETPTTYSSRELDFDFASPFNRSFGDQFCYLFCRSWKQMVRDRHIVVVKVCQVAMMAALVGTIFWRLPMDSANLNNYKGVSFITVQLMQMLFLMHSLTIFWRDFALVVREYQANMYSPTAYFLAKSAADSLQYFVLPFVFAVIVYNMAGLPLATKPILTYFIICILLANMSCSLAHVAAAVFGDVPTALAVLPLFTVPLMVFGGFFIKRDTIQFYFEPLKYLSWHAYAYEAVLIALFGDVGRIPGCRGAVVPPNLPCSTGPQFVRDNAFDVSHYWFDLAAIVGMILVWKLVGTVAFTIRVRRA